MNKYHKSLMQEALRITNVGYLRYNLLVNKRNGHYAIDKYNTETGRFEGAAFIGNYKECYCFLQGLWEAWYICKNLPF